MMDAVSDTTKLNWLQIYELPAVEFLSYFVYYKWKKAEEKKQIEEFRKGKTRHY